MGLSNEERYTKMVWAAHHITKEAERLRGVREGDQYDEVLRVRSLCDQIWPALLGRTSNAAHWIFGSSAVNDIKEGGGPWAIALCSHFEKDDWLSEAQKSRQEAYWKLSPKEQLRTEDPAREKQESEDSSVDGLLAALEGKFSRPGLQAVYRIFACTESVTYALRRYDDDFRQEHQVLDQLISNLQGACFAIFATDERYAKAYLLSQILRHLRRQHPLISSEMAWCRQVLNWVGEHYVSMDQLKELHLEVALGRVKTVEEWVELLLHISTPRDRSFRELVAVLTANKMPFDRELLERLYREALVEVQVPKRQEELNEEHLCAIHGYATIAQERDKQAKEAKEQKDGAESHRVDEAPVPIAE